jgi:hypothetical protein
MLISVIIARTFVLNAQSFRAGVRVRMGEDVAVALAAAGFVTLPEAESVSEPAAEQEPAKAGESEAKPDESEAKAEAKNKKR